MLDQVVDVMYNGKPNDVSYFSILYANELSEFSVRWAHCAPELAFFPILSII